MTILVVDINVVRKYPKKKEIVINSTFWEKASWIRQKDFIAKSVDLVPVARAKVDAGKERNESRQFFFDCDLHRVSVCRDFFQKTLGIGKAAVETAIKRKSENGEFVGSDGRGRASSANRTGNEEMEAIKRHMSHFQK